MPRILPFKDPEPEEINGFKDITEAVNFLDIIIQCDGQSINNKEHFFPKVKIEKIIFGYRYDDERANKLKSVIEELALTY